jgi:predicted Fe-S protein YdhL (DUF1289 family)
MAAVSTPCIRICILDDALGLCRGCGRTAAEITRWGLMSEEERLAIMRGLQQRLDDLAGRSLASPQAGSRGSRADMP